MGKTDKTLGVTIENNRLIAEVIRMPTKLPTITWSSPITIGPTTEIRSDSVATILSGKSRVWLEVSSQIDSDYDEFRRWKAERKKEQKEAEECKLFVKSQRLIDVE